MLTEERNQTREASAQNSGVTFDKNRERFSFTEVRRSVAEHESKNAAARYRVTDLRFEDGFLKTPDGDYRLAEKGMASASLRLGAAVPYVPKLEEPVRSHLLNYYLQRGDLRTAE